MTQTPGHPSQEGMRKCGYFRSTEKKLYPPFTGKGKNTDRSAAQKSWQNSLLSPPGAGCRGRMMGSGIWAIRVPSRPPHAPAVWVRVSARPPWPFSKIIPTCRVSEVNEVLLLTVGVSTDLSAMFGTADSTPLLEIFMSLSSRSPHSWFAAPCLSTLQSFKCYCSLGLLSSTFSSLHNRIYSLIE